MSQKTARILLALAGFPMAAIGAWMSLRHPGIINGDDVQFILGMVALYYAAVGWGNNERNSDDDEVVDGDGDDTVESTPPTPHDTAPMPMILVGDELPPRSWLRFRFTPVPPSLRRVRALRQYNPTHTPEPDFTTPGEPAPPAAA